MDIPAVEFEHVCCKHHDKLQASEKMKAIVRTTAILLLFVNGIGAIYGGFQLITDPTGAKMQMPLSLLENSPFDNYLIPGITLFVVNGVMSFITLAKIFLKSADDSLFIIIQGILLTGWMIVQLIMLTVFFAPLQLTFLATGVCLFTCGLYLRRRLIIQSQ